MWAPQEKKQLAWLRSPSLLPHTQPLTFMVGGAVRGGDSGRSGRVTSELLASSCFLGRNRKTGQVSRGQPAPFLPAPRATGLGGATEETQQENQSWMPFLYPMPNCHLPKEQSPYHQPHPAPWDIQGLEPHHSLQG